MRNMFRPHRAIFRQHIINESTALCTLSIVLLKYIIVIIIIIKFGVYVFPSYLLYCGTPNGVQSGLSQVIWLPWKNIYKAIA
jgi:hypothetical protein